MKKIITLFMSLCLFFTLTGCSSKKNDDDILAFFEAFDNTLNVDSGILKGNVSMDSLGSMDFTLAFSQEKELQLAFDLGLMADKNIEDDFLSFYIKDGKTYLNSLGTKTQSKAENIGLDTSSKLSVSNPFLSFTDDELASFFSSSKKEGNHYTFDVNTKELSKLLDSFGSVEVETSTLEATIDKKLLSSFTFQFHGIQKVGDESAVIDLKIQCEFKDINKLESISFPNDLDSYKVE